MGKEKDAAFAFLQVFEKQLRQRLPKGVAMDAVIREVVSEAKTNAQKKHLRLPETAFLNYFVLPSLFQQIQEQAGLSETQAKDALLNEYHRTMPEISRQSPIHALRHPFAKIMGATPEAVFQRWLKPEKGDGLTQSCPDFALRKPFPYSIVFEGKYFRRNASKAGAAKELVGDLYQAFFYRGLPKTEPKKPGLPGWDYDYACLLAFDASRDGTMKSAWNDLNPKIQRSFWESANVYVMILRD
jgi:hypothetical protein